MRWDSNAIGRRVVALNVNYPATGSAQIARSGVFSHLVHYHHLLPGTTTTTVYKLNAGDYVEVWSPRTAGVRWT